MTWLDRNKNHKKSVSSTYGRLLRTSAAAAGQAAGLLGGLFRVQFLRIFAVLRLAPSRNYAVITRS